MIIVLSPRSPNQQFPSQPVGWASRPLYFLWDGRPARPLYLLALPRFLSISCSIDPDRP
jgi:hypothetical protein